MHFKKPSRILLAVSLCLSVFSENPLNFFNTSPVFADQSVDKINVDGALLKITSPAFKENEIIPNQFTCEGANQSPPLAWDNVPTNTKTFALVMDDPDAPGGTFVHWVLFNVPVKINALEQNVPHSEVLENGVQQGVNDFSNVGYGGPCPPSGVHRYFFKLYALDDSLNLPEASKKKDVFEAMKGHVLAEAILVGRYQKQF